MGQLLSERQGRAKAVGLLPQEQGREGWEGAILPGLAASQGITAGSLDMELVRGWEGKVWPQCHGEGWFMGNKLRGLA